MRTAVAWYFFFDTGAPTAFTGTGAVAFKAPELEGTGVAEVLQPAVWRPRRRLHVDWRHAITGTGSTAIAGPELAGTGTIAIRGAGATAIASADGQGVGKQSIGGSGALAVESAIAAIGVVNPFARAQAEDEWMTGLDAEQGDLLAA